MVDIDQLDLLDLWWSGALQDHLFASSKRSESAGLTQDDGQQHSDQGQYDDHGFLGATDAW
jgi:hypothetical protein